ncbi:MAG TPA: S8 family serine peptidase [Vicinamibacteria bacterium]|nr:S8 family serine peptidase [Vicinamibacteria bacterium]
MKSHVSALSGPFVLAALLALPATGAADDFTATPLEPLSVHTLPGVKVRNTDQAMARVIVKFEADSVAAYKGDIPGLPATSPQVTGATRLDFESEAARAYERHLITKEQEFEANLHQSIPNASITHRFRKVVGGVAMTVPRQYLRDLSLLPGVQAVYEDVAVPLSTDRSPAFIGAPILWAQVGGQGRAGEGVIVGMIDTGVWPEHPSLADDGTYPAPPAKWHGTSCQFGSANPDDPAFACNHKLIGARRFMNTFDHSGIAPLPGEFNSARDNNGHGTHTATTATGDAGVAAGFGGTPLAHVSGIAPRAHVAVYKVCFTDSAGGGQCFNSDSAAAIEQAIADGVDVISFSIGGGANPYSDVVELAFLDAYRAGVFVSAAAGNSGPGADTVEHRGPWVTTVAASTTDRVFQGSATITADGTGSLTVTGASVMGPITSAAPVVLASAPPYSNPLCLSPAAPGSLTGKIVVCRRGTNARVAKGFNVLQGGAVGMILYNTPSPNDTDADVHFLPAVHIDSAQGVALLAFLGSHTNNTGTFSGGASSLTGQGDVIADFSSRGGPNQTLGVSKPDVAAPGVNILAGQTPKPAAIGGAPSGELFQIISGTSMATPHVSGTAALLKQLHPHWTPGQIKSAIMTTALTAGLVKGDGITPADSFDLGSGRIDLRNAGLPGLTFDAPAQDFLTFQTNLSLVNYPSLYVPVMPGKVTVPRTVFSDLRHHSLWLLSVDAPPDVTVRVPEALMVPAHGQATFDITVDARAVPLGAVRHATLFLENGCGNGGDDREGRGDGHREGGDEADRHDDGDRHEDRDNRCRKLHFPITFDRRQAGVTLDESCDPATLAEHATTTCTITATNTTFNDASVHLRDRLPRRLSLVSVTGAVADGTHRLTFDGTLAGATPPDVHAAAANDSPAGGYLPLSLFGIAPLPNMGDETLANFAVPAFRFASETYTQIGMVSNGYLVVGGGVSSDIQFLNQHFPNPAPPNNVLAPFWTDLDATPARGGAMRVGSLSDGVHTWIVFEWDNVPNFSNNAQRNSFQVWVGVNGVEDISYVYGPQLTAGEGGFLTVGGENKFGSRGANFYYNGTGTLPVANSTQVRITSTPGGPGETKTVSFTARAGEEGAWTNCAEMTGSIFFGTATACVTGAVTK